jgi:two-component system sensor histidine kinase ChiS
VSNAVKFTEKGTITICIVTTAEYLEITVKDTGIGIAEEDIPKLYESFTQIADSGQQIKNGTGLGLALTKYFVEAQGGLLQVESTLGVGTEFKMKLKLATPEQLKDHPITSGQSLADNADPIDLASSVLDTPIDSNETASTTDIQPYLPTHYPLDYKPGVQYTKVLIVDDEPINRTILRGIGRKSGYIIIEASNGSEAIEAINNGLKCDIILLDIMMPKLSGIDTCKLVRKFHTKKDLPIIFISAKTQQSDIDECLNAEGNEFLPKPINKEHLLHCIERYTLNSAANSAVKH